MIFSDLWYPVFLLSTVFCCFLVPKQTFRIGLLILASYAFYFGFEPAYVLLLASITLITFLGGILLERSKNPSGALVFSLVAVTASFLIVFKYLDFLSEIACATIGLCSFSGESWTLRWILPVGISFYTFQAIGYLVEVYVGRIEAERNLARLTLFLCFFPQLVAGPIERARNLLPKIREGFEFDYEKAVRGVELVVLGLAIKIFVADHFAQSVDVVFANPASGWAPTQFLGVVLFSFQVYADFFSYSLIAVGSALTFGVDLIFNFRQPYLSTSIPEFWRNWHISLSHWLRDYVYTPLSLRFRNKGRLGIFLAIAITFFLAGVWHGAGWTFVIFGLIHVALMIGSTMTDHWQNRFWQRLRLPDAAVATSRAGLTFLIVTLTFVLFRATDLDQALTIYGKIFSMEMLDGVSLIMDAYLKGGSSPGQALGAKINPKALDFVLIASILVVDFAARKGMRWRNLPKVFRFTTLNILVFFLVGHWAGPAVPEPFVYFQF